MGQLKQPIHFSPPPTQLGDILRHLQSFLLAAIECKCVRKSKHGNTAKGSKQSPMNDFEVHTALFKLEITLNPQRLAFDDNRRKSQHAGGWPNIIRFARLYRMLREGVDSTLQSWGWETLCTSTSMQLSVAGLGGKHSQCTTRNGKVVEISQEHMPPGCFLFKERRGWRPWVQQSVVDDLVVVRDGFVEYLTWYDAQQPKDTENQIDEIVTLSQVAPLTGLSKRTLERCLKAPEFPQPDFRGGNGKAHKWFWRVLRPALSKISKKELPVRFPTTRII